MRLSQDLETASAWIQKLPNVIRLGPPRLRRWEDSKRLSPTMTALQKSILPADIILRLARTSICFRVDLWMRYLTLTMPWSWSRSTWTHSPGEATQTWQGCGWTMQFETTLGSSQLVRAVPLDLMGAALQECLRVILRVPP